MDRKRADTRAPKRRRVATDPQGLADILGQTAYVRALADAGDEIRVLALDVEVHQGQIVDHDLPHRCLHLFAAMSLLVQTFPADLDGGGHRYPLRDDSPKTVERGHDLGGVGNRAAGLLDDAVGVARGRSGAEPHTHRVLLRQVHQQGGDPGGLAHEHQQESGGERIECARVPDLVAEAALDTTDDVVAGAPRGLVHQHDP